MDLVKVVNSFHQDDVHSLVQKSVDHFVAVQHRLLELGHPLYVLQGNSGTELGTYFGFINGRVLRLETFTN